MRSVAPDLVLVIRGDPLEDRGHVLRVECALRILDDRAVHAVAVGECGGSQKADGGCGRQE